MATCKTKCPKIKNPTFLTAETSVTTAAISASDVTDDAHSQGETLSLSYATESEELLPGPVNAHNNVDESEG